MSTYRLAFAVSMFFPYGGMQRTLLRIARECVNRGHEVHIYTGAWRDKPPADITVHELDTKAATNHRSNELLAKGLEAAVATGAYDCLTGFTKIPGLDIYYAADPCYADRTAEERGFIYRLLPRYRTFRRQEEAVFHHGANTEILLIAHQEREKFIHYYDTESDRFHLLPPGISRDRLLTQAPDTRARENLRSELGVSPDGLLLLGVGSRFKTKGVDRLISAFASLPHPLRSQARLVFVGHGDAGPYRRQASRLGVGNQVIFTGTRDDVAQFYFSADLLVHTPYTENTGTVLIEAMLCGLPVLTTGNCGFAFHVGDAQAGRVCSEPFVQEELNRHLAEMVKSGEKTQWRLNGPAYCKNTDIASLITRAADVILARAAYNRSQHDLSA